MGELSWNFNIAIYQVSTHIQIVTVRFLTSSQAAKPTALPTPHPQYKRVFSRVKKCRFSRWL